MDPLTKKLADSPVSARVVPFVIFLVLTFCQDWFGEAGRYWFYLAKTIVGAWLVWSLWPSISEMRWAISWEAVTAGIFVFAIWVGLDGFYPKLGKVGTSWNPHLQFAGQTALAWLFIIVRIAGSSIVVPPLEEVFFRSFLYRYIIKVDFLSVPIGTFQPMAFAVTSAIFGFEHHEWLPGILCGFTYQGLVCWKKRLGDAMMAHALTNLLLGLWVVWKGAWHFW